MNTVLPTMKRATLSGTKQSVKHRLEYTIRSSLAARLLPVSQ